MPDGVVLVTGGSGYVASSIINLLQDEGWKVRTSVRDVAKYVNQLSPEAKLKIEVFEADLNKADSWKRVVKGCRYVIHVASPFPMGAPLDENELIRPAVDGTLNVLKACAAAKTVKRVVVTSSTAAVRGGFESKRDESFSEKDWTDTDNKHCGAYVKSKTLAEKAAWKFVKELPEGEKFELAVVNPSLVLGPLTNCSPGSSVDILAALLRRDFPILPGLLFPVCDVRDVALAHYRCMTQEQSAGHRHVLFTQVLPLTQMAGILSKELKSQGYNIPTIKMPDFIFTLGTLFSKSLQGVSPFRVHADYDTTRMRKELGITPTPIEKTILDTAHSLIQKGFVPKTDKYTGPIAFSDNH